MPDWWARTIKAASLSLYPHHLPTVTTGAWLSLSLQGNPEACILSLEENLHRYPHDDLVGATLRGSCGTPSPSVLYAPQYRS